VYANFLTSNVGYYYTIEAKLSKMLNNKVTILRVVVSLDI